MARDRLRTVHRLHQRILDRLAGEWVTYEDGELSVKVRMVRGQTETRDIADEAEFRFDGRLVDWLIEAAKFCDDQGVPIEPSVGACIKPISGEAIYDLQPGPSGSCFSWSDGRQVRLRIHTERGEKIA